MHNFKLLISVVFNTNLCQHHAKIFISFKPETLFHCSGFNSFLSGFNPYRSGINYLYRGITMVTVCISDFGLDFEFERYIPLTLGSGINIPVGKKPCSLDLNLKRWLP
jgi:hypothetical protein